MPTSGSAKRAFRVRCADGEDVTDELMTMLKNRVGIQIKREDESYVFQVKQVIAKEAARRG